MDLISRQSAIEALGEEPMVWDDDSDYELGQRSQWKADKLAIESVPPEREAKLDEWCTDCKEYDKERHCCPRWNRVIRNTVEELKAEHRWIPVTERLPDHEFVLVQYRDNDFDLLQFQTAYRRRDIVAWMPLPPVYKAVEGEEK